MWLMTIASLVVNILQLCTIFSLVNERDWLRKEIMHLREMLRRKEWEAR